VKKLAAALIVLCAGCTASRPGNYDTLKLVFPEPAGTFEEDVSARRPYDEPPEWILKPDRYPERRKGAVYFTGVGLPRDTVQAARDSAFADARRQIVRYMGTTVGVETQRTGTAVGDTRGGGYESVTDRVFSTAVAKHDVSKLTVRDRYYTAGMLVQDIAKKRVHLAYVLVEFAPDRAAVVLDRARDETRRQIKQLETKSGSAPEDKLDARERQRLETLRKLREKLDNLSAEDFQL
jgi:hypothetical protein